MLPGSGSGGPPPPPPPQESTPQSSSEDEEEFTNLPDDGDVEEALAEQRALFASFETKWCDEAARHLMLAERRAAVGQVAACHACYSVAT
jgi:hypothetical protein